MALKQRLGLSDCIFTFDALHCQEKTLDIAHATGNEVIVQVKENQPTLLQDCQTIAQTQPSAAVYQEPVTKARESEPQPKRADCDEQFARRSSVHLHYATALMPL